MKQFIFWIALVLNLVVVKAQTNGPMPGILGREGKINGSLLTGHADLVAGKTTASIHRFSERIPENDE